ncbi:unnamed protein product [Prorocentrum cordatum]|uniref:Uncharacterized protein n=1 Tax=Prorocentrum cordatum TaxID=2364126 RepID=A0ABN9SM61_9DINO|nr:unnamed protein product [Polarella glacialis]
MGLYFREQPGHNCARKGGIEEPPTTSSASLAPVAAPAGPDDVLEELRAKLVEWQKMPGAKSRAQVDGVIAGLAAKSGMEKEAVRMLWLTAARQARPVGAPVDAYVSLAKKHHGVGVEVIDLGGASAKRNNSCMFLTCSAALADRRAKAERRRRRRRPLAERRAAEALPTAGAAVEGAAVVTGPAAAAGAGLRPVRAAVEAADDIAMFEDAWADGLVEDVVAPSSPLQDDSWADLLPAHRAAPAVEAVHLAAAEEEWRRALRARAAAIIRGAG